MAAGEGEKGGKDTYDEAVVQHLELPTHVQRLYKRRTESMQSLVLKPQRKQSKVRDVFRHEERDRI